VNAPHNHLKNWSERPLCRVGGFTSSSPLNRHCEAHMPLPVIVTLTAD
jgi:hypothetical protein